MSNITIKDEPDIVIKHESDDEAGDELDVDTDDEIDIEPPGFDPDAELIDLHILACTSPAPGASPHYSESLTRLQKGFLGVIAHLEARNASLTEDLAIARSLAASATATPAPAPAPTPAPPQVPLATHKGPAPGHIFHLETALAAKNITLKEKHTTIAKLERSVKYLGKELEDQKRRSAQAAREAQAMNRRLYDEMMVERRARMAAEGGRAREDLGGLERKRTRVEEMRGVDVAKRMRWDS